MLCKPLLSLFIFLFVFFPQEKIEAINQALVNEYEVRRKMLLKRLDVTVQSFGWSERAKVYFTQIVYTHCYCKDTFGCGCLTMYLKDIELSFWVFFFFLFFHRHVVRSWPKFIRLCVRRYLLQVKFLLPIFWPLDKTSPRFYAQAVARWERRRLVLLIRWI